MNETVRGQLPSHESPEYRRTMERLWTAEWDDLWKYWNSIETKTQILLGTNGIILGVVLAVANATLSSSLQRNTLLFVGIVASLGVSCAYCVGGLWVREPLEPPFARTYKQLAFSYSTAAIGESEAEVVIYIEFERQWLEAINSADNALISKVGCTRVAQRWLAVSLLFTSLLIVLLAIQSWS